MTIIYSYMVNTDGDIVLCQIEYEARPLCSFFLYLRFFVGKNRDKNTRQRYFLYIYWKCRFALDKDVGEHRLLITGFHSSQPGLFTATSLISNIGSDWILELFSAGSLAFKAPAKASITTSNWLKLKLHKNYAHVTKGLGKSFWANFQKTFHISVRARRRKNFAAFTKTLHRDNGVSAMGWSSYLNSFW